MHTFRPPQAHGAVGRARRQQLRAQREVVDPVSVPQHVRRNLWRPALAAASNTPSACEAQLSNSMSTQLAWPACLLQPQALGSARMCKFSVCWVTQQPSQVAMDPVSMPAASSAAWTYQQT